MAERSPATRRSLGVVLAAVFAFLYIPIGVLIALSFNEGGLPTVWSGFSLKWYRELFNDGTLLSAAWLSLKIGMLTATAAVVLGMIVTSVAGTSASKVAHSTPPTPGTLRRTWLLSRHAARSWIRAAISSSNCWICALR